MRKDTQQNRWSGSLERLEDRLVMSADPLGGLLGGQIQHHSFEDDLPTLEHHVVAEQPPALEHHLESQPDFWISSEDQFAIEEELRRIDQQLANAHDQTGLTQVRNNYGFTGIGQTVAVIDSGIAYDHFALGGGFGQNYRVVGGYDFTGENDADPYDDGPSGSHGTHVAGIVGGDAGSHNGVAPGVDLVALRVFDDAGAGYFSWVENALDWIHTNRNSFENPITAVNLSLGVASWNSDTIPSWANLEDEFAQLEADGIFISVSAGNSFTSFNEAGLSYPAASQYVVPVASVDDSGLLSYFSQRNSRVIAAPGRGIYSTVPDYKGDNDGIVDDYASFSGTSMAAPYVAGASVIIREAMEFAGYTNITQDTIYDHMIATADSFFDSATNQYYNRLNLDAAISALIPADDYGSTEATGYNLGTVGSSMSMNGAITTLNDVDYFNFTAESTGTVTFAVSNTTHNLTSSWISNSPNSLSTLSSTGDSITLDVVAGQSYSVGYATGDGLGYYDLDITSESTFTFTDWGTISSSQFNNINIDGEAWYRVAANSTGYFTVGSEFDAGGNQIHLELYNANLELIDSGNASNGTSRVDAYAAAGDELFIRVLGTNSDVDFQLTNLVSVDGTTVNVSGTAGDDAFAFTAGNTHQVVVNGVAYEFADTAVSDVQIDGGQGNDSVTVTGSAGNETATFRTKDVTVVGLTFTLQTFNIENSSVHGGGGSDIAIFYDSAGDDVYVGRTNRATLRGNDYFNEAWDFSTTHAYASGGHDHAVFYDSAGDDVYVGRSNRAELRGSGFDNNVYSFERTIAYSSTGYDIAVFYDSVSDDVYVGRATRALMVGDGYYNDAYGFERAIAYSSTGSDKAVFHDTAGDDIYVARSDRTSLSGDGYYNTAYNFGTTETYATTGSDRAIFYDTAGDDVLVARHQQSSLRGTGYFNRAWNFDVVDAYATTGHDLAILYDSPGDDVFVGRSTSVYMRGEGYKNSAYAFNHSLSYASSGHDIAVLYDSAGDDIYVARATRTHLVGEGFYNDVRNFNHTLAYSSTGNDRVVFHDTAGDDIFVAKPNKALMTGSGYYNDTRGFNRAEAYATTGNDRAVLHDSDDNDNVHATTWGAYITDEGSLYWNEVRGFDSISAYSTHGGSDSATETDALDYLFSQIGNWS